MKRFIPFSMLCIVIAVFLFSCKKDATCVCVYTEENYSTNITTKDTFLRKIKERKSAQKKACESPNFSGTNTARSYNYETKCWLQ